MAITFVNAASANGGTTGITPTMPTGITAGDLILVSLMNGSTSNTWSAPTGYTPLRTVNDGTAVQNIIYYRFATGSGDGFSTTVTSAARWVWLCAVYRGVDSGTPFVVENGVAEGATAVAQHNAPSINNTNASAWGVYTGNVKGVASVASWTAGTGLTERLDQDGTLASNNPSGTLCDTNGAFATGSVSFFATHSGTSANASMWAGFLNPAGGGFAGTATLTGDGTLTSTQAPAIPGTATLTGSGTLSTTAAPATGATASLSGSGTLATTAVPAIPAVSAWNSLLASYGPGLWWKLTEASGSTAADTSGNSRTGTYNGTPGYGATGQIDKAVTFSGDDWVRELNGTAENGLSTAQYTAGVLFKTTATAKQFLALRFSASGASRWGLIINNVTTNKIAALNYGTSKTSESTSSINDGNWHLAVLRQDATTLKIFVDGVEEASQASTAAVNPTDTQWLWLGADNNNANNFVGTVDEFFVLPTALSATSIADLWAARQPGIALSGSGTLNATGTAVEAHVGTATFTGDGTLSTAVVPKVPVTSALSGSGTLSVTAAPAVPGTATLSGSGTLTTTQVPRPTATVTLSGSGTLATIQVPRPAPAVALSGDGTLSTTGLPKVTVPVTLSGSGTLSAIGVTAGQVVFTGSGTLTTAAVVAVPGVSTFTGSGTLTTTGVPRLTGVATLSGSGTLITTQVPRPTGTATLVGSGTLTVAAVPKVTVPGALTGTGVLTAIGYAVIPGQAVDFVGVIPIG